MATPLSWPSRAQDRQASLRLGQWHRAATPRALTGAHRAPTGEPLTMLCPGYRELPDVEPDTLQKQADHCNDRRMASKRVQELSTGLFFAILVRVRPPAVPAPFPPCAPPPCLAPTQGVPLGVRPFSSWGGPWGNAPFLGQPWLERYPRRRVAPWSRKPW